MKTVKESPVSLLRIGKSFHNENEAMSKINQTSSIKAEEYINSDTDSNNYIEK